MMDAVGGNHSFETAVADLVDNSIDAGATNILLRVVTSADCARQFLVVDDGKGIAADAIDEAMTFGGARDYKSTDLGHFGWGLKAASLSQADSLTVLSHAPGSMPVGRCWLNHGTRADFDCGVVDETYVQEQLDATFPVVGQPVTIVRWDRVRAFPQVGQDATSRFLEDLLMRLDHHLGLVFHRFIQSERIRIWIDVLTAESGESSGAREVSPIDPFGYLRSPRPGYPKPLTSHLSNSPLRLECHIWPGRSSLTGFRLPGGHRPDFFQGFFFYRRDRLLQAGGGWNSVEAPDRALQLARVCVDLSDAHLDTGEFRMNPEKTRVEAGPMFAAAVEAATADDGTGWYHYLDAARDSFKQSKKKNMQRRPIIPPGRGLAPAVRSVLEREFEFTDHEPLNIRWSSDLEDDEFFAVDREESTIWLNRDYRWAVLGDASASLNDAPLVKALIYLLAEDLFNGAYLGVRDKDNIEAWQKVLTAAARVQAG